MKKVIGILAHVDAGKTTLSEQILYHTKSIRTRGRVDHKNSFLDTQHLERERGITIFSHQAVFQYGESSYYLVDTPGHVDFSAEMERTLSILDYAIIVVSCVEGIQGHTETIWRMLRKYHVPTFFFLNKIDRIGADINRVKNEIQAKFTDKLCDFTSGFTEQIIEQIALIDEKLLAYFVEKGFDRTLWKEKMQELILSENLFICFAGSALNDIGIEALLEGLESLSISKQHYNSFFSAKVYKIRHDKQGNRLVFMKVTGGSLVVKQLIGDEKVNEIRIYHGEKYSIVKNVLAGELCAVTGLSKVYIGDIIGDNSQGITKMLIPTLTSKVIYNESIPIQKILGYFKILEDEEPMLNVVWDEHLREIQVNVMGIIQLEVLKESIQERFGINVSFGECKVLYMETIKGPVFGYGHYEPLKHYAEVHVRLEPSERGSGITFESCCSVDILDTSWQRLVQTHVLERRHLGILTASELTDVKVCLLAGKSHEKHTEGGDFREATYRAIRQGLEKSDIVMLEPYYQFTIYAGAENIGRILSDLQKMYAVFEPAQLKGEYFEIKGRSPVYTMMNYSLELMTFSKGKGTISCVFDGYDVCHNSKTVIERIGYNKIRDMENVSDSVFCSHGAGFVVKWDEAKNYMHLPTNYKEFK